MTITVIRSSHDRTLRRFVCLVALLRQTHVTAIADVRSAPYSRHFPHFNRDELRSELRMDGISYVFLGKELVPRDARRDPCRIRRASATLGPSDFKSKNRGIQIAFLRTTVFTAAGLSPPA